MTFPDVPAGPIGVAEVIPDGYQYAVAFCYSQLADASDALSPVRLEPGSAVTTTMTAEHQLDCDVYNIPYGDGGGDGATYDIEFGKYLCDAGAPADQGKGYYEEECEPAEGWEFSILGPSGEHQLTNDASGSVSLTGVPATGGFSAQEHPREGYGQPRTWCRVAEWAGGSEPGPWEEHPFPNVYAPPEGAIRVECHWYNFPLGELEDGRITVYAYQCAPGTTASDFETLQNECTTPHNGVPFTLGYGDETRSASTAGGAVDWLNLDQGSYTVTEEIFPGYEQPRIWCGYVTRDGTEIASSEYEFTDYSPADGAIQLGLGSLPAWLVCHWYSIPSDPGEITIHTWLCPPGYDFEAWDADPKADCSTTQDGVTFTLHHGTGDDLTASTGTPLPGAVTFGELDPGAYAVTETVPPDTAYSFVLDCTGTNIPKVHPVPLSWGNVLNVSVAGGDAIVCNWYNVPLSDLGWITLHAYTCWTPTFISTVDCEIHEHGTTMELLRIDGDISVGSGTTDAGGTYTWNDLAEGSYNWDEFSPVPCKTTTTKVDGEGNIWVDAGQGTDVHVYTCASTTAAFQPGKAPAKYPNTGAVPPGEAVLPGLQDAPAEPATPSAGVPAEGLYDISCLDDDEGVGIGTPTPSDRTGVEATEPPEECRSHRQV